MEQNAFSPAFFGAGGRLPMGGLGVPPFCQKAGDSLHRKGLGPGGAGAGLCRFRRGPPVHPGPPSAGGGGGLHQAGLPHPGGRPVPNGRLGGGALSSRQALPLYAGGRGGDLRRKCGAVPGGLSLLCGGAGAASPKLESLFLGCAP